VSNQRCKDLISSSVTSVTSVVHLFRKSTTEDTEVAKD